MHSQHHNPRRFVTFDDRDVRIPPTVAGNRSQQESASQSVDRLSNRSYPRLQIGQYLRVTGYCGASEYLIPDLLDRWTGIEATVAREFDEGVHLQWEELAVYSAHPPHSTSAYRYTSRSSPMISPDQFLSGDESERPQPLAEESEDLLDSVRYQQQQQIQEAFVFKYGAAVFWGMTKEQEMEWMRLLARYATDPLYGEDVEVEEFSCVQRPDRTPKIFNDLIVLTGREDDGVKLAISLAIGQSVKLERFEWLVEDTLESSQHIPPSIAATGTSKMSRTDTVKAIGTLFNIRSDIYLRAQILNTPELFRMEQQQLLPLYSATRGYLEISQRVLILNQRLLVINDVLYLLHKHLTKTHGESLVWIIIGLVFTTTVIAGFEIFIKLQHFLG